MKAVQQAMRAQRWGGRPVVGPPLVRELMPHMLEGLRPPVQEPGGHAVAGPCGRTGGGGWGA